MGELPAGYVRDDTQLGGGAYSDVFAAHDTHTGEAVVLKRVKLTTGAELRDAWRREVLAALIARVPGVLAPIEVIETETDGWWVTPRCEPGPFGGDTRAWSALLPFVRQLLRTVGMLHGAGVVHADIKPDNLLRSGERLAAIDLGFAGGAEIDADAPGEGRGTPRFLAPEVRRGGRPTLASDLYAVGCTLYHALTGDSPLDAIRVPLLYRGEADPPLTPLGARRPDLPPVALALVDRLLAPSPSDRPTAVEALRLLGDTGIVPDTIVELAYPRDVDLVSDVQLRALFHGPDHYLHLREDGAALLFDRTGGDRAAVVAELEAWVEQGFATVRDGLIEVDRVQLRRLGSDGPAHPSAPSAWDPAELAVHAAIHVLGPHADDASVCALAGVDVDLLAALADRRRIWRRTDGAWGGPAWSDPTGPRRLAPLARSALARFVGDAELPAQVELSAALRWLVLADFGVEETARTCRRWIDAVKVPPADALQVARVLLALGEPGLRTVALEWATCAAVRSLLDEDVRFVRRLLRRWADLGDADHRLLAAREALDGRRFHEADGAFQWDDLPASSVLYGQWVQTGVMIGRELRPDAVDAWLDRFRPSTEDPRHFSWIGAAGLLAYHRGQWTTAVTAFRAALDAERLWGARLGMLSNLAAASLALDEVEEAEAAARRGLSLAVRARDVRREVLLHRQLREARWRRGDGDVELDRTQAAMLVSPKLGAGHALLDAAILWRHGRLPEAARVASETLAVIRGTTLQPTVGALLLGLVCDASPDLDELQRHACEVAGLAARHPGIVLQVLALAWPRGRVPRLDEAIRRHSHAVPRHQWSSRREILSVDECLARRCVAPMPL